MIVDDEAPARSELRFLLEQTGKIGTITEASSVRSAIEMLMESRVDVVFLDISMPGASGLQLAEALHKLKNPPAIVFVTAYSDHAVEAFDVDAVDYLMKPVEEARLDRAIDKVMQRAKPVTDSKVTIERIPVEKGGRKVLIPVDDIRFIMAKDDYSCIYTVDDRFLSTTSLAQFEAKLCDFGFFRVHRRYIVNLACVTTSRRFPRALSSWVLRVSTNAYRFRAVASYRSKRPSASSTLAPQPCRPKSSAEPWGFLHECTKSFCGGDPMNSASAKRIDIISDTHGYLSPTLLDELKGADLIIHAGDLTSEMDYEHLRTIAPVRAVLGNNDYYRDYGPDVDRLALFTYEGLKFAVAHYREDLPVGSVDVAINGHTHVTKEAQVGRCLVLNPGSASYPRGTRGPTMARMLVKDGHVISTKFIDLD